MARRSSDASLSFLFNSSVAELKTFDRERGPMPPGRSCNVQELGRRLLQFTRSVEELLSPDSVLDGLHKITLDVCEINVMAATMFPLRWGDPVEKGRTLFLHKSVPHGWWKEYQELSLRYPSTGMMIAQAAIAPFTISDITRSLEPVGIERWSVELALKYGMRDGFTCPVGGRWAIVYWSRHVLSDYLTPEARAILFMGATFAALRLERLIEPAPRRCGDHAALTPRELSVLRLMSIGHQVRNVANLLELGEETIRTHLKKAQAKLGVHNRAHAVAQAIRRRLIP
jgi:LuxR family quorum sensing-dependent transcriptional regulator